MTLTQTACGALALLGAFVAAPALAQDATSPPHRGDLASMNLTPLDGQGPSYRLIWHAWHRRPGSLTLWCEQSRCQAELRYTDGYGTYNQGRLHYARTRPVSRETAQNVMAAMDQNGFWQLTAHLPTGGPYGDRPTLSEPSICLHAPHYFLEGRRADQSRLVYRYCQPNVNDGLVAVKPMIDLFDTLFPDDFPQVKAVGASDQARVPLKRIDRKP
jgi:hypothetical protein